MLTFGRLLKIDALERALSKESTGSFLALQVAASRTSSTAASSRSKDAAFRGGVAVSMIAALIVTSGAWAAANEHDHGSTLAASADASGSPKNGHPAGTTTEKTAAAKAPSSSSHKGEMVSFPGGEKTVSAYLAVPKGKGAHPGIVVIQEWWGLNDQIRGIADDFARKGYVALAPDLYHGKVTADPSVAVELLKALSETAATAELTAAVTYLGSRPSVADKPVGSIGFCMGGRLSLLLAMAEPKISACVVCYGRPETDSAKLASIKAPLLGLYGGADRGIPLEMVDNFKKAMEQAGKSIDVHVFPGAPHGFLNPINAGYSPRDEKEAWRLIDAFFAANLTGARPSAK